MTLPRRFIRSLHHSRRRLNNVVVEKEEALTGKALAETRTVRLESFRKNFAALAFAYGLVVVFCYCFFDIRFFPSGLSTGDVLFFLFAALALGFMSLVCSALGMSLFAPASFFDDSLPKTGAAQADVNFGGMLWFACPAAAAGVAAAAILDQRLLFIAWPLLVAGFVMVSRKSLALRRSEGRRVDWTDTIPYASFYLFIAPLICYLFSVLGPSGWTMLALFAIGGMAGVMGLSLLDTQTQTLSSDPADREKLATRRLGMQVFFVLTLLPALFIPTLRISAFTRLGVRTEDMAVSLDKQNLALLQSAADTAGVPLSVCRGEDGQATVAPIDVLWHASGTRSLVHIGASQGVDVELNTSGLRLVRGKVERCLEINESLLFGSGTSNLLGGQAHVHEVMNKVLSPLLADISEKWKIKSVKVVGHADPMPLPADGNDTLAKNRAETVRQLLLSNPEFVKASAGVVSPEAISDGSRHPIRQCDTKEPAAYQRSCNEANRRVEIRFRLERRAEKK